MSEQVSEITSPDEATPTEHAGPLTRLVEKVAGHIEQPVEHLAAMVAGDVKAIAKNHAGLFGVVAEALDLIDFIDPADAAAIKAAEALVSKLFTMAANAAATGSAALKPAT